MYFSVSFVFPHKPDAPAKLLKTFALQLKKAGWQFQFVTYTTVIPESIYQTKSTRLRWTLETAVKEAEKDILLWWERRRRLLIEPACRFVWLHPNLNVEQSCVSLPECFKSKCDNWAILEYHVQHSTRLKEPVFSVELLFQEALFFDFDGWVKQEPFDEFLDWTSELVEEVKPNFVGGMRELWLMETINFDDEEDAEYILGCFYILPVSEMPYPQEITYRYYWRRRISRDYMLFVKRDL